MWRFKFSAWAVVLLMTALSFGACDNDDDDTFVPPSNITEALKQVYPCLLYTSPSPRDCS